MCRPGVTGLSVYEATVRVTDSILRSWCRSVLLGAGVNHAQAESVAAGLVQADLRGIHTHGVEMLARYVHGFREGYLNPRAHPQRVGGAAAVARWDGDNGLGHFACERAAESVGSLASEYGIAAAAVFNSNHFGIAGRYAMQLASAGLIGFTTTNTPACMPAIGSALPVIGNNPLAWALPRRGADPIVLDMSSSVVARGKIRLAAASDESIPTGWALDENGKETTDAEAALKGVLLPIGGAKGFGLAVVNEILSVALSGARTLLEVSQRTNLVGDLHDQWGVGHFVIAISPELVWDADSYFDRVDDAVAILKSQRTSDGNAPLLPGEPEAQRTAVSEVEGIAFSRRMLRTLDEISVTVGVEPLSRTMAG